MAPDAVIRHLETSTAAVPPSRPGAKTWGAQWCSSGSASFATDPVPDLIVRVDLRGMFVFADRRAIDGGNGGGAAQCRPARSYRMIRGPDAFADLYAPVAASRRS